MNKILFFIDYPQDLDMLFPLIKRVGETGVWSSDIWVSSHALKRSPRILKMLKECGFHPKIISRKRIEWGWLLPPIRTFNAVITSSESNLRPHRAAYRLTLRANQQHVRTFTLQHGFENAGLSYFDSATPAVDFASSEIWVWGARFLGHPQISRRVLERCVPVGLPKQFKVEMPVIPNRGQYSAVVSIFENLHWSRYSQVYREAALKNIQRQIKENPEILFIIKPHHDERWLARHDLHFAHQFNNVIFADPQHSLWQNFTAPAWIQISDLVITTPSTVALDAAMLGKPVCIIGESLDLKLYEPLVILRSERDWDRVIQELRENSQRADWEERSLRFRKCWIDSEEGADNILKRLNKTMVCT